MGLSSGGKRLSYVHSKEEESELNQDKNKIGNKGTLPATGNSFRENILEAMTVVEIQRSGYFGKRSGHKGKSSVRVVESSNPARTALEFVHKATKNYVSLIPIKGKGYRCIMRDGTEIVYRRVSSSKDKGPVVELTIHNLERIKSQKIHFVERKER